MTTPSPGATRRPDGEYSQAEVRPGVSRLSTETKSSLKTTELLVYVLAVAGVLVASYLVKNSDGHDDYFRADRAWFFIVLLTIGYMGGRGLAKSGSREHYDGS
jgi:hypothetical protein